MTQVLQNKTDVFTGQHALATRQAAADAQASKHQDVDHLHKFGWQCCTPPN
jgi:hypothetical protein